LQVRGLAHTKRGSIDAAGRAMFLAEMERQRMSQTRSQIVNRLTVLSYFVVLIAIVCAHFGLQALLDTHSLLSGSTVLTLKWTARSGCPTKNLYGLREVIPGV
jgi:hypothetical protein